MYNPVHSSMHRSLGHSHISNGNVCKQLLNIHQCLQQIEQWLLHFLNNGYIEMTNRKKSLWLYLCMWLHSLCTQYCNHRRNHQVHGHNKHFHHMDLMNMMFPLKIQHHSFSSNMQVQILLHAKWVVLQTYQHSQIHPMCSLAHNNMHRTLGHWHISNGYVCKQLLNIHQYLEQKENLYFIMLFQPYLARKKIIYLKKNQAVSPVHVTPFPVYPV